MSLQSLIAHPKTFLKSNALWPSGQLNVMAMGKPDVFQVGTPNEGSRVWPIELRMKSGVECKTRDGAVMPCWEVAPSNSLGAATLAYYLPWQPNSTRTMQLGDKADFFITDTMNGCSFGFGPGGNPRVAHVNYNTFNAEGVREEGKPIDQAQIDAELKRLFPTAVTALRKADYSTANFPNVTVIGVRRHGQWKFVYQKRDYLGSAGRALYVLKSVHTIR